MERLMQYLDYVEDLVYAFALVAGRMRRALKSLLVLIASIALPISVLLLTLTRPPLGLAVVALLSVILLYRAVVNHPGKAAVHAR